jgi:hypothetical protein
MIAGLMAWNLRLVRGFEIDPPPLEATHAPPRAIDSDSRPMPAPDTGTAQERASNEQLSPPEAPSPAPTVPAPDSPLAHLLDTLNWTKLLSARPGWTRQKGSEDILCPYGQALRLSSVEIDAIRRHRARVFFQVRPGVCLHCPHRERCFTLSTRYAQKIVNFTVSPAVAHLIRDRLDDARGRPRHRCPGEQPPAGRTEELALASGPVPDEALDVPVAGPLTATTSLFLPARARRLFDLNARQVDVYVQIDLPAEPIPHPALLARSVADRQHQRQSWQDRFLRYALPEEAEVHITVEGPPVIAPLFGENGSVRAETA